MNSFVPKDWHQASLDEISTFRRGSFPQPYGSPEWFDENGYPFVQVYDVGENNRLKSATKTRISKLAASQSVFVPKGAVVVTIQGSIGRVAITQYDAYFDRTILIFNNISPLVDRDFFAIMVKEVFAIKKEEADGGVIKTITKETLKNFIILLPSLEEQQKIATILTSVDTVIEKTRVQIDKLKHLKTAMMQELLTQGIGHTEFKDSPVGKIPISWEVVEFSQLAECKPKKYNPLKESQKILCIELEHIEQESGRILGYINSSEVVSVKNRFSSEDVLFSKLRPYLKKFAFPKHDGICTSEIWVFTPKNEVVSLFLFYIVQSEIFLMAANRSCGTKMPRAELDAVMETFFAKPPVKEQQKIARILQSVDEKITAINQKLTSLENTKKALMQDLLTGKVRVDVGH